MLRQCEADLRREINKAQKLSELIDAENMSSSPAYPIVALTQQMPSENINIVINKRVEVLKFETTTTSTPNSPKASRFSPRKTHVSNFIYQNTSPTDLMRRKSSPDTQPEQTDTRSSKYSPQLHLNGRRLSSPPKSPTPMRRRFRSQSPRLSIDSESDTPSDEDALRAQNKHNNLENDILRRKPKPKRKDGPHAVRDTLDRSASTVTPKKSLLSFRSIDMGNNVPENCYCPQSEPLKRKVYTGSQTLERLKKSLEQESGKSQIDFQIFALRSIKTFQQKFPNKPYSIRFPNCVAIDKRPQHRHKRNCMSRWTTWSVVMRRTHHSCVDQPVQPVQQPKSRHKIWSDNSSFWAR